MLSRSGAAQTTRKSHARPTVAHNESSVFTKYIGALKITPSQQQRMSLGVYGADRPAKGFMVEFNPDPKSLDSIETEVTTVGAANRYEMFLTVVNSGPKPVAAEVWRM
jgi:hypothetical protein